MKFLMNKKYRFKRDFPDRALGKIPQGMTVTYICNDGGLYKFRLPNREQIVLPEKSALNIMEELH